MNTTPNALMATEHANQANQVGASAPAAFPDEDDNFDLLSHWACKQLSRTVAGGMSATGHCR